MAEAGRSHVLIAGVTTRALALSAVRAGYRVTAVDAFGDLDLRALVEVIAVKRLPGRHAGPLAAARAGAPVAAELVAYTSNFENSPRAVERLAQGRRLLGNPPDVLARVRNPLELMRVLRCHGLATPETRARATATTPAGIPWLLKPRRSGGGHGIRNWHRGVSIPRSSYLQERIAGVPGSVIFAANGDDAVLLGFSRQLVADSRLGARAFRYCGSLLGSPAIPLFSRQDELLERAAIVARTTSREFGLVGLNGIDFIARGGVPYPIEVNPRYSASMELVERAQGISMFEAHLRACRGELPPVPAAGMDIHGKAIVFTRHDVILGDTVPWLGNEWLADVPHPGERIRRGHPLCTVFARAHDGSTCRRLLLRRAAAIYRLVESKRKRAA
jgi:predicted ATP-grasp superfamily ATP-dependent carboligase